MPEGHTIHRLARHLGGAFAGQQVHTLSPQGRFADGAALLDGGTVETTEAIGKQLLVHFSTGILRVHLGLYGKVNYGGDKRFIRVLGLRPSKPIGNRMPKVVRVDEFLEPPQPVGQVRLRIIGDHGWADLRGLTACEVINDDDVERLLAKAGPDPLRAQDIAAGPGEFVRRVRKRKVAIGQLLMEQSVISGVGNIYRAELLFRAGLDPYTLGADVPLEVLESMWEDAVFLLRDGERLGRIVTTHRDPNHAVDAEEVTRDVDAIKVPPASRSFVYKRAGRKCVRCGTPIAAAVMVARNLFWCPGCQLDPDEGIAALKAMEEA